MNKIFSIFVIFYISIMYSVLVRDSVFALDRKSRHVPIRKKTGNIVAAATLKSKPKEEYQKNIEQQKEENKEPTREQYNKYYQLLNDLNSCVNHVCSPNGSKIPSICFNVISADQKIKNNCMAQLTAIKNIHPVFELEALVDVKTKLLNASKKACDGLSGSYSGGNPPNKHSGEFMSFGICSVKVGYSPEQLNKGETHSVKNMRRMDIGTSRVCNMASFGVSASDMISDGNEKNAIALEIQSRSALLSLGIDAGAAIAKQQIAKRFVESNGKCICTKPTNGNICVKGNSTTELGREFIRRGEAHATTREECEEVGHGYSWVDNFDNAIGKAKERYNDAQKVLVSECVKRKDGVNRYSPEPYIGNIDELSDNIKKNLELEENLIIEGDKSIIYLTSDGIPTKFGAANQKIKGSNGQIIDPFADVDNKGREFVIPGNIGESYYGLNSGKQLQKREISESVNSSMEKEECLCSVAGNDFSHYDLWDNNTVMCYYTNNKFMNIRIVKQGKNFEKGVYVKPIKEPSGSMTDLGSNTQTSYNWQIGAIEQVEGAYSKAMLTQYMTNVAIKTNMRNLHNNVKSLNSDIKEGKAMASVSDVNNAMNNGDSTGSFQKLQNTIGNINSLQQMQTDANKKYNAAVSNYESAEARVKGAESEISSISEEQNSINTLADGWATFGSFLKSEDTIKTLATTLDATSKKQAAIDATKEIRTGFCYIVTKDNKIGQVIAKENEPFKISYDLLYKNK